MSQQLSAYLSEFAGTAIMMAIALHVPAKTVLRTPMFSSPLGRLGWTAPI